MTTTAANRLSVNTVALWTLKIVLALLFLVTGTFKLTANPMMVAEFNQIGLGQWFLYFTGLCELAGAVLLLIPVTAGFGALLMLGVSVGAFLAQLLVLHMDVVHTVVLIVLAGGLAWVERDTVLTRLGLRTAANQPT